MSQRFSVQGEITTQYTRFNAMGTQVTVHLSAPPDDDDLITHLQESMAELFEFALRNCTDSGMVGINIHNQVNQNDKPIGISFRSKDPLSGEVVWTVFKKEIQCNARFNALDTLVITVHFVRIPVGFGRVKTKGRLVSVMVHLKGA
jgi:hypothetical protein